MSTAECGTKAGWDRHMRGKQGPACEPCHEANTFYMRSWRRTKGIGAHHYPITVDPRTADIPTLGGILAANFRAGA